METNNKLENERLLQSEGCIYIAGIDEVGRGPLCGPVVCSAVILPHLEHFLPSVLPDLVQVAGVPLTVVFLS